MDGRGGGRRATVDATPALERADTHWDLSSEGSGSTLQRPRGPKIRLLAIDDWAQAAAGQRLSAIEDVDAACQKVRACLPNAPAMARDLVDGQTIYGARACAALVRIACGSPTSGH